MSVIEACHEAQQLKPPVNVPEQPVNLAFSVTPKPYFRWKSMPDRVLAVLLLLPALPVIGILIVAVRLTSRGPGIYRQVRAGKKGKPFTMLKLRSMASDAEAGTGAVWTRKNDPRVTRLGRVLRKLHLDEIPQLINVVRGEMSLIGPRPERPEFVEVLEDAVPGYVNRLTVRPGITGLAQINLPPDNCLSDVRRKLALDLAYVDEAGPWLDVRMLLCTIVRVLGIPGDVVMVLFRLRRDCRGYCKEIGCCDSGDEQDGTEVMSPAKIRAEKLWGGAHKGNGNGKSCGKTADVLKSSQKHSDQNESHTPHKPR